jgi:antitoxin component YwqK of YwqJK toxin-antitoxin module
MYTRLILLITVILIPELVISQDKCFYIDETTDLAYSVTDSTLYSGICSDSYRNGNMKYCCKFKDGVIKYSKAWSRKGVLVDSTIYLNGDDKMITYTFYKTGELKEYGTSFKTGKKTLGLDNYDNEGTHIMFWKNGNKKSEVKYYNDRTKTFLTRYYKNGNLKYTGLFYEKNADSGMISALKRDSIHCEYNKDGILIKKQTYVKGKLNGLTSYYDINGNLQKTEMYKNNIIKRR